MATTHSLCEKFIIFKMLKEVSNTIQNCMFMKANVFKIAGVQPSPPPPPYQVWVPKAWYRIREGLIKKHIAMHQSRHQSDFTLQIPS